MMLTALTLLLLSADPAPSASASSLAVVSTADPGLEKVALEAGRTLGSRLEASHVDLGGYLKSRGEGCQEDPRCLLAAPGLSEATFLLHLSLRPVSAGRLAVDLRLIELESRKVIGRSASVVETGGLSAWAEASATRLISRADPYAKDRPQSPFAVKPAPETPTAPPPPAGDTRPRPAPATK
ncbi:hypothetical protein ATI61_119201 [Archangium gephyra]|uniref:DUF2380 domain-containing protein n=1 Tax=Archangium gephyra TaxID=48 RepID=A0AAC8QAL6_9BACT|nr:hypothetical protein [Archangium gephyra]AKJ03546.1 Hypothetical protein AA314_05172 [Archangium gephyra]REG22669.1 hypothetical protein ATI61_119201 [Archangium gephyra]